MNTIALTVAMALIAYALRCSGLFLSNLPLSPFWTRVLHFVPVAVFAALIGLSLRGQQGEGTIRVVAALGAGVALWYRPQPWVGLVVGIGLLWLLRAVGAAG